MSLRDLGREAYGWIVAREEAAQPGACSVDDPVRLVLVRDADGRRELAERELVLGVEEPTQNVREWKAGIRGWTRSQHSAYERREETARTHPRDSFMTKLKKWRRSDGESGR